MSAAYVYRIRQRKYSVCVLIRHKLFGIKRGTWSKNLRSRKCFFSSLLLLYISDVCCNKACAPRVMVLCLNMAQMELYNHFRFSFLCGIR